MAPDPQHRPGPRRVWFFAAAAGLLAVHLLLANHFIPLRAVFGPEPLRGDDYDLHIGQTYRVLEGLAESGRSWAYDVKLLAGQPEGTIVDAGNKGLELWTFCIWKLGASKAVAFNSFVLFVTLVCPLLVFLAARLFRLGAWAGLLAAAMTTSLWFFDSFCHWLWFVGMVSYSFAACFALLPLALFYRFIERPRAWLALSCGSALAIDLLVHPYSFFILALPMAVMYVRGLASQPLRTQAAALSAIGLLPLAVNAYWLRVAFQHWHYVLESAYYGQAGPAFLVTDFLELLSNPTDTGVIGTRSAFRLLYFGLAAAGLVCARGGCDQRLRPLGLAVGMLLVLAYFGRHIPGAAEIQPYRHLLPASFFATLPAAAFVETLRQERALQRLHRSVLALLAVAALLISQQLTVEALYFLPNLVPETLRLIDGSKSPISKYGYPMGPLDHSHVHYGLPHDAWLEGGADELVRWVSHNLQKGARVLVDGAVLGERIAWKTDVEVMGGFRERNIAHAEANFFRRYGERQVAQHDLATYLRTFGIGWVITEKRRADFERAHDLLAPFATVMSRQVYKTRIPVGPVLEGSGQVHARTNHIDLTGSSPMQNVVLSYHWHEALRCEPGCRIERAVVPLDTVGLIRIPAPHPANLSVVNRYR